VARDAEALEATAVQVELGGEEDALAGVEGGLGVGVGVAETRDAAGEQLVGGGGPTASGGDRRMRRFAARIVSRPGTNPHTVQRHLHPDAPRWAVRTIRPVLAYGHVAGSAHEQSPGLGPDPHRDRRPAGNRARQRNDDLPRGCGLIDLRHPSAAHVVQTDLDGESLPNLGAKRGQIDGRARPAPDV
jgi:hypothetical protein